MLEHRIGSFAFLDLAGEPDRVKRQISVLNRAGVDGVTLVDQGSRGTPFQLRSSVDQVNLLAGRATFANYCQLIGADPVELIWQDLDLASEQFRVAVLDVRQVKLHALAWGSSGGLHPPSLAWLECDWTLIPIADEVTP